MSNESEYNKKVSRFLKQNKLQEAYDFLFTRGGKEKIYIDWDNKKLVYTGSLNNMHKYVHNGKLPNLANVIVKGNFKCKHVNLVSLEGSPSVVERDFEVDDCNLNTLKGAPEKIGGHFSIPYNNLENMVGCPKEIGGDIVAFYNSRLRHLKGCPNHIKGNFYVSNCDLESLIGGPSVVEGEYLAHCNNLTNIEGLAKIIGDDLTLMRNPFDWSKLLPQDYMDYNIGRVCFENRDYTDVGRNDDIIWSSQLSWVPFTDLIKHAYLSNPKTIHDTTMNLQPRTQFAHQLSSNDGVVDNPDTNMVSEIIVDNSAQNIDFKSLRKS